MNLSFKKERFFGLKSENINQFNKNESLLNKCRELADELLEINKIKDENTKIAEEKNLLNAMFHEKLRKNLTVCSPLDRNYSKTPEEKSLEEELKQTLKIYTDSGTQEKYEVIKKSNFLKNQFEIMCKGKVSSCI